MPNRLADSLSPYLRSHAGNPVDWWPWGEEAFAEARRRDVPVFLSVGYAACHWCHVMAHESFEDAGTAALLNDNFVSIKVDREEHPDVDAVYMQATQALTGRGGWPMSVFADADGRPFYAGTYFPPAPRPGMPSFPQVLDAIADMWRDDRARVDDAAERIVAGLAALQPGARLAGDEALAAAGVETGIEAGDGAAGGSAAGGLSAITPAEAEQVSTQASAMLDAQFDDQYAGFGGAPKFPPTMALQFLLRRYGRLGQARDVELVARTCWSMAGGGMYDQLAGGFARYSVDQAWVVPHFEKMLYDNAQLVALYSRLWVSDPQPRWAAVARATGEFMLRDLRVPGGFASALDADAVPPGAPAGSLAEEGASYAWTPGQLAEVLGPEDGQWVAGLCHVTSGGTFEDGASVLQLRVPPAAGSPDDVRWQRCRRALLAARDARPQPARDDKVVTAWNGLAISGLAQAGALLDEPRFVAAAAEAAGELRASHWIDGRLRRVSRDGVVGEAPGVLEDYGALAQGLLDLYAVTGETTWVEWAGQLLDVALSHFADGDGGFYDTADDAPGLILRPADPSDNASPSGWSATTGALLSYAALTGSTRHRDAAEASLARLRGIAEAAPRFAGWSLAVAEAWLDGPVEVAVVGLPDDAGRAALHAAALRLPSPGAVVAVGLPAGAPGSEALSDAVPLLAWRGLLDGKPAAYACRGFTCQAPVTDPELLGPLAIS